jgi:N-acetylneuraminic acid mutarotase
LAAVAVELDGESCVALTGGSSRGEEITSVDLYRPGRSPEERWMPLPDLPAPRALHAVASDGVSIYVFGGLARGTRFVDPPLRLRLDQDELSWESLPPPPTKRNRLAAAHLNGKIYVVGGIEVPRDADEGEAIVCGATMDVLDLETMNWESGPPMPTGRHGHTLSACAGKLYAVGGYGPSGQTGATEVFDPGTGEWRALEPIPEARGFHGAGVVDGRIIVVGGRVLTRTSYLLDTESGRWSAGADIPELRNRLGVAVGLTNGNDRLLVFGGEDRAGLDQPLEPLEYDPRDGTWR